MRKASNSDNTQDFGLIYRAIGLNIAYYRKLKGLTQMELAEKVDISRTHLSNIEAPNVHTSISLDLLLQISQKLDVSPYKLLLTPDDHNTV